ncbi:MAG TPA: hypothetical protein VKF60_00455, partial [Myxococcota bacterium]|nr:hypothetical protein [Myxococcota bacterium]
EGNQIAVESQDYRVRFERDGAVAGSYFISDAKSEDWTSKPVNARLRVFGLQTGSEYLRGYPDFHLYRSASSTRLENAAASLSLVAANREIYGTLRGLLDRHERRERSGGERLCVTLSGTALSIASAESLEDGRDVTARLAHENDGEPIVYADQLDVEDCSDLLAAVPH